MFLAGGVLTWVALVGLAVGYGADLKYRFELAAISVYWLVLIITSAALMGEFRRATRAGEGTS